MKTLSISVAAYNAEKCLETCLDSLVISEIMEDIEVLIINDGSTDGTAKIAEKYVSQYPSTFVLINKENGGHGSTINTGIKAASGKYFKLVDADDWVEKEGLIKLVNRLKTIDADAVLSPYYKVHADSMNKEMIYSIKGFNEHIDELLDIDSIRSEFALSMHGLTYRTTLLQENFTAIDEHCFYVDMEFLVFYFRLVKSVFVSDVPVYDYLVGTNEQSVNITNMIKRRDQHLRVCKQIINYYHGQENTKIVQDIINDMINVEYLVLLAIPDFKQSKSELLSFEEFLKDKGDVYINAVSNGIKAKKETAYVINLLRKTHYRGLRFIHLFTTHFIRRKYA